MQSYYACAYSCDVYVHGNVACDMDDRVIWNNCRKPGDVQSSV